MWQKIASGILHYRIACITLLAIVTVFMVFEARHAEMTYNFGRTIPVDNPKYETYQHFLSKFGEDGNVMVIGVQPDNLFDEHFFNSWNQLAYEIKKINGVADVLWLGKSFNLVNDTLNGKIKIAQIFPDQITSQQQLDSLKNIFLNLPFYAGRFYNPKTQSTLMAVSIEKKILDSPERVRVVQEIQDRGNAFAELNKLDVHYSGLPLIRTVMATQVAGELKLFLLLAAIVTGIVLFLLMRSFSAVIFSLLVVGTAVIWTLGIIVLLGYKISLLTGLMPPLTVVIGITNCVYLLNKYHIEFLKLNDKNSALQRMVERIGLATLFTNLTAAIGFGVFYLTQSEILKEFGIVAFLSITSIFIISIILIPCVFSFLPAPKTKQTVYLDFKSLNWLISKFEILVLHHRRKIYTAALLLILISAFGISKLNSTGYIVDDLPHRDKIYTDLQFFQDQFNGVMPLEVMVEGKEKNALKRHNVLQKIDQLQDTLAKYPVFAKPLSIVEAIKFVNQAKAGGNSEMYALNNGGGLFGGIDKNAIIFSYLTKLKEKNLVSAFVDSNAQTTRISFNMKDIGSDSMNKLFAKIQPQVNSIFDTTKYKVSLTGTSVIFLEGSKFIINGLWHSLLLAFLLIAICMGYLFRSARMILISVLPNLVPLCITAGIMGYFHIPLKPSTVLVFSVAFGIAIDNAIRFLAKYEQELRRHHGDVQETVLLAMHEAGISIIYTSFILFFGFIIFTASKFGGTFYLGLLTSITLVVAMFNNLLLLPSLLITFKNWIGKKHARQPADIILEDEFVMKESEDIPAINSQKNT
jgi:uncharacterized protein